MLTIDGYNYYRPADFQVWFDSGDIPSLQREIQGFPYELGLLKAGIKDLTLESSESGEDAAPYRLKGTATQGLAAAIGFYSAHTWAKGIAEVEILISGDDLLPTRFEGGIDGFNASFSVEYSNFGANLEVSLPEEAWDFDYLQRLRESTLSVEEMGRMLRVFPVEGQKCVEVDIGSGLYLKVISGENFDEEIIRTAFWFCEGAILSVSGDLITPRTDQIGEIVDEWDLSVLSISPDELVEQGVQCLRLSIGLSDLFDIGNGRRAPTLGEVALAEKCKASAEEEGS